MSSPPQSVLDVVGLGVFIAGRVYAPDVAAVIGPYFVLVLAAVIGASFAVARREQTTRLGAMWYFMRVAGVAVMLTGVAINALTNWNPDLTERVLIAPVALVIGSIGDDWGKFFRKVGRLFYAALDLLRTKGAE